MNFVSKTFTTIFLLISVCTYAQHGKYSEAGMRRERPLTTLSNSIQIELSYPEFNPTITGVSIVYGQLQSGIYFISSKKFNDNADLDSLIINQKKYYNIFKLNNIEEDTIFYNQQYGILKIVNKLEKLELL